MEMSQGPHGRKGCERVLSHHLGLWCEKPPIPELKGQKVLPDAWWTHHRRGCSLGVVSSKRCHLRAGPAEDASKLACRWVGRQPHWLLQLPPLFCSRSWIHILNLSLTFTLNLPATHWTEAGSFFGLVCGTHDQSGPGSKDMCALDRILQGSGPHRTDTHRMGIYLIGIHDMGWAGQPWLHSGETETPALAQSTRLHASVVQMWC